MNVINMFKKIKSKFKKDLLSNEKIESSNETFKNDDGPIVTGHYSIAAGVRDIVIPTGICNNPVSEELKEYIKKDKLGQLLCNPICQCIFYNKPTGYCFFSGNCAEKSEISKHLLDEYIKSAKEEINKKYEK